MASRIRGFTLLEVLVALSIFAVIGLGANRMLSTMLTTHARVQSVTDEFAGLGKTMMVIDRDLTQIVDRPVRDEYGEQLPALSLSSGTYLLEFTRTGWNNPASLPRSRLQRVAYELTGENDLVRHTWWVLDRAEDSEPTTQTLLRDVESLRIQALDADGTATDAWPDVALKQRLPNALEVLIDVRGLGEIRKIIALVSDPVPIQRAGGAGSGPGRGSDRDGSDDSETGQ